MKINQSFSLGQCEVNTIENKLLCGESECVLQPKFVELLCFLVMRYPELVTREDLIDGVWDGNQFVGEKALTNAIWHLRKTFKELDPAHAYIATVRKTGYRLAQQPVFLDNQKLKSEVKPQLTQIKKSKQVLFSSVKIAVMVATVMVCLAFFYFKRQIPSLEPLKFTSLSEHVETITTSPGRELFPAISNDSHFIVYSWRRPGQQANLYLRDLFSPEQAAIALTESSFLEGRAVFSHDLNNIFYYRRDEQRQCEIVKQNLTTAVTRVLATCGQGRSTDLDINAAGNQLVFISDDKNDHAQTQLNIVDLQSNELAITRVPCSGNCDFNDESVVFSPDGKQLVVSRNLASGYEELFLVEIATGNAKQLTSGFVDIRGVDWHPSKDLLVFSGVDQGKRHGYFYELATGRLVDAHIDGLSYPEYSQDGSLYFHQWDIDSTLMRVETNNVVASSPFPVLSTHFNTRFPDYSATKNKLVFVSNESGTTELWIANKDGTQRKKLTQLNATIYSPVWSPDGRYIAFVVSKNEVNSLRIYDFNSQSSSQINTGLNYHGKPSWAPDSKSILTSNNNELYRFNLKGDNLGKAIEQSTMYAYEDKHGALIFADIAAKQLWIKQPDSGHAQLLVESINLSNHSSWYYVEGATQALSRVYYFNVERDDYRLSYYDFSTQSQHDLMRLPERAFSRSSGLTYIENIGWLVYTSYKSPQIDIKRIKAEYLP
ncbi:PD40 domain-containing protein [Pseudoalteromonas sp. SR44-8]|uniref:winged helix-turn-helix domain-containing protein n=1 Tax=Pseudoalteromonas sp. SR44-8 TaxID=2760933 RepID=UPI0015FF1581|nr:winged helix-turn-helix domain-containing protein [Pseudoalteromonas sp. SR44-8]MBB1301102.1 PD40 domain-containing protein [Pseudoalteromonas sp. SR44-8]